LSVAHAARVVALIAEQGQEYGIIVNRQKSIAYSPEPHVLRALRDLDLITLNNREAVVLGSPIGSKSKVQEFMQTLVDGHKKTRHLLTKLAPFHQRAAFQLLRQCAGPGLLTHASRTIPTPMIKSFLRIADNDTIQTLKPIAGLHRKSQFDEAQLIRISTSFSKGGYGLRSNLDHAEFAYYTSLRHSIQALSLDNALSPEYLLAMNQSCDLLEQKIRLQLKLKADWVPLQQQKLQNYLSAKYEDLERERFEVEVEKLGEVRGKRFLALFLTAAVTPEAQSWLYAKRSEAVDSRLWRKEWNTVYFGLALQFGLGMDLFATTPNCPACNSPIEMGDHLLHAKHRGYTHGRTGWIVELFIGWCTRFLGQAADREQHAKSKDREGDFTFRMDQGAEVGILFVDQTIRSTLAHLDEAINFARCKLAGLSAISVPERAERNKYQRRDCVWFGPQPITAPEIAAKFHKPPQLAFHAGEASCFWPIATAAFGGLGPGCKVLVSYFAKRAVLRHMFPSESIAYHALSSEMLRLQMQHCMMTLSDYQTSFKRGSLRSMAR
jgi:hypothetical protein